MIGKYLEEKARKNAIPIHGYIELTPLCNLDCKMCYVHLSDKTFNQANLLSVEVWKNILEEAHKAGMKTATLSGGECLTYPAFKDVFMYLYTIGISISVNSNGLLLDEKCIDFFRNYRPNTIQITLYGSCNDAYERVTGRRVFDRVYHNIVAAQSAGLPIKIAITPNRFMIDDMERILELVTSLGLPYDINCKLISPRANTGRKNEDMSLTDYVKLFKLKAMYQHFELKPIDEDDLPSENHNGAQRRGLMCGAGRSSFAINYEGNMMPCVSLNDFSVSVIEQGFNDAWKKINEYANDYSIPCECFGCAYFDECIHCQGLHKDAMRGHCDTSICERIKALAKEGLVRNIKFSQCK